MATPRFKRTRTAATLTLCTFALGCQAKPTPTPQQPTAITFQSQMDAARRQGLPVAVLAFDPSRGERDQSARSAFEAGAGGAVAVELDLTLSRNRADAAPLHGLDAPTLVCLSSHGVVVSRDEGDIPAGTVRQRIALAAQQGPQLDADLDRLTAAVDASPAHVTPRMALADFLLARHNDSEAVPQLRRVAADDAADLAVRVRAWVAMARSHLWMVEPEKARHAAQSLMATLGPRSPEAMAGGNLVRGLQDTKAKRYDRARDELAAAASVAPASAYGREASALLARLPPLPGK